MWQAVACTDCLIWLWNFREPEGQVARWFEILAEFKIDVQHRPEKQDGNVDALSRNLCPQCNEETVKLVCVTYLHCWPVWQLKWQFRIKQNRQNYGKTLYIESKCQDPRTLPVNTVFIEDSVSTRKNGWTKKMENMASRFASISLLLILLCETIIILQRQVRILEWREWKLNYAKCIIGRIYNKTSPARARSAGIAIERQTCSRWFSFCPNKFNNVTIGTDDYRYIKYAHFTVIFYQVGGDVRFAPSEGKNSDPYLCT